MTNKDIQEQYYQWLTNLILDKRHEHGYSYLLEALSSAEFIWTAGNDINRAADGVDLHGQFSEEEGLDFIRVRKALNWNCSVLEMMVALACRCEDSIMCDEDYGNRTAKWFWTMVRSLGLADMNDKNYDDENVQYAINAFLNRDYKSDGEGGLFTIRGTEHNMKKAEIWYQMCWYMNDVVEKEEKLTDG